MRRQRDILFVILVAALTISAVSRINLTRDVTGLLPVANAGTGVATASANYVFAGPLTGSAAAPSFKAISTLLGVVPTPNTRRWAYYVSTGTGATQVGEISTSAGTVTNAVANSTNPPYAQWETSTVNGNVASNTGNKNYVAGRLVYIESYIKLSSTVTRRDWINALSDQTPATMGAADNPAGNYAGFTYSTARGDTDFMCASKDNTTQQIQSSGVAIDSAAYHKFAIYESVAGTYQFYIDGALVCTNSTNPPTSGTAMAFVFTSTCLTCTPTAVNFRKAWNYMESNF